MVPELNFPPPVPSREKFTVLLVISSQKLASLSKTYLERPGLLEVTVCYSGDEAIRIFHSHSYDLILSDYDLDDMDAITLHTKLQDLNPQKPFLLFTITDRDREILEKYAQDPSAYQDFEHDISIIYNDQAQKIAQAVELFRTRNQLELYTRRLEQLVEERTRQLQVAQRFAVIGELATMIGHDMRNPLQVITNMQYLLEMKMQKMTVQELQIFSKYGIMEIFSRIRDEILYLNKIVSDLQDYARQVNPEKSRINLAAFFHELLLTISPPSSITVIKECDPDITVSVDPALLTRVMENVIMNALQAMEKGGILTLKSQKDKEGFSIIVSDTGGGIPPESVPKIFDPLYTTKPKGTGLGLSVTKRLI
ncbi:ATP-binding protein, partial [Methanospirillum sp.]